MHRRAGVKINHRRTPDGPREGHRAFRSYDNIPEERSSVLLRGPKAEEPSLSV